MNASAGTKGEKQTDKYGTWLLATHLAKVTSRLLAPACKCTTARMTQAYGNETGKAKVAVIKSLVLVSGSHLMLQVSCTFGPQASLKTQIVWEEQAAQLGESHSALGGP